MLQKHELVVAAKDIEKLKDELNCKDIKCNWIEENLRKELSQCQVCGLKEIMFT